MPYADPQEQKTAQAKWYQTTVKSRRAEWLAKNGPCRRCGSAENLEVDHVDPAQKASHRLWTWSTERRAAELAKCQVLCAGCHSEKTNAYNLSRGTSPWAKNYLKTKCDRGHPFDLLNTIFRSDRKRGCRECRTCHNERRILRRREMRAA